MVSPCDRGEMVSNFFFMQKYEMMSHLQFEMKKSHCDTLFPSEMAEIHENHFFWAKMASPYDRGVLVPTFFHAKISNDFQSSIRDEKSHGDNIFMPEIAERPEKINFLRAKWPPRVTGVKWNQFFFMQKYEIMFHLQFEMKKSHCDNLFLPEMAKIPENHLGQNGLPV